MIKKQEYKHETINYSNLGMSWMIKKQEYKHETINYSNLGYTHKMSWMIKREEKNEKNYCM